MHSAHKSERYRRILMTGGTGFVGATFCPDLVAAYPDAERILVIRPGSSVTRLGFEAAAVDLLDGVQIDHLVAEFKPDLVLHLAAQASVVHAADMTWRVNVGATINLASAVARHRSGSTVFFVSTGEVYGLCFNEGPADETTTPCPTNPYARSKFAAELIFADILSSETRLIIARSFNHTGVGQDARFVIPAFAAQIAAIEAGQSDPTLHVGNLDAERDFLDVRDVSRAYVGLLDAASQMGPRNTFNIASGRSHRIGELLEKLKTLSDTTFDIAVDTKRLRASDVRRVVGRYNKLRSLTGWQPQIAIENTLQSVLDYQRQLVALKISNKSP